MKNSTRQPMVTVYNEGPSKGKKKDNTDPCAGLTGWKRVACKLKNKFIAWGDRTFIIRN